MAVEAVKTFEAKAHPLGSEIVLTWEYPDTLPDNFKHYIFKRRDSYPTSAEITAYFEWLIANVPNTPFVYDGLFVFTEIENFAVALSDFGGRAENERLKNTKHYFYSSVIFDTENKEYSSTKNCDAVANKGVKINILDGKEMVAQAIARMFDGLKDDKGNSLDLRKYIDVLKHLPIEPEKLDFICVKRISGETRYSYINSFIAQYGDQITKGDIDADVIEAEIYCIENPQRRDQIVNIFRAYKQFIKRYCIRSGALEALVSIMGDSFNPTMNNATLATATVHIALLIENTVKINFEEMLQMTIEQEYE